MAVLDGCSRYIMHWEIRESMTERDVELVIQRARELFPDAKPRIISDNGPQFVSRDFKEFIRVSGMSHVRTSPYYPQANGKFERFNRTIKTECVRPKAPLSLADAKRIVTDFIEMYNFKRLHSALGFIRPYDRLVGRHEEIFQVRDAKLEAARARRRVVREHGLLAA
jgi:transposase InsO family protein